MVTAGHGDGEVARTMRALRHDGFDGFFSLEPHLQHRRRATGGFSGPELFRRAWQDFTDLLKTERDRVRMSTDIRRRSPSRLVGAGVIGKHHGLVISQLADRLELVAVADIQLDRAEQLAAERGGTAVRGR